MKKTLFSAALLGLAGLSLTSAQPAPSKANLGQVCSSYNFCFSFDNTAPGMRIEVGLTEAYQTTAATLTCVNGGCLGKLTVLSPLPANISFENSLKLRSGNVGTVKSRKFTKDSYEFTAEKDGKYITREKMIRSGTRGILLTIVYTKSDLKAAKFIDQVITSLSAQKAKDAITSPGTVATYAGQAPKPQAAAPTAPPLSARAKDVIAALNRSVTPSNSFVYLGREQYGTVEAKPDSYEIVIVDATSDDTDEWTMCSTLLARPDHKLESYVNGNAFSRPGQMGVKLSGGASLWFSNEQEDECAPVSP